MPVRLIGKVSFFKTTIARDLYSKVEVALGHKQMFIHLQVMVSNLNGTCNSIYNVTIIPLF